MPTTAIASDVFSDVFSDDGRLRAVTAYALKLLSPRRRCCGRHWRIVGLDPERRNRGSSRGSATTPCALASIAPRQ
jgi:hypothetical protein